MTTLLVIAWLLLVVASTALLALRPKRTAKSRFELNRLKDDALLRRERLLGCLFALRRVFILVVFAAAAMVSMLLIGGWSAILLPVTIVVSILLARIAVIVRFINVYYIKHEAALLRFVEKNTWLGVFMLPGDHVPRDQKLESTEQLLHLAQSSALLTDEQLAIIKHGLSWHQTPVSKVMIPREQIVSVKHSDLLGPLVLDDLHKSGHSQFPVIKKDLDTVVGLLDITLSLEVTSARESQKAGDSMSTRVIRAATSDTLPQALALLQKSKQHVLIVVDDDGKTAGLVTLADITGSLLGKTGVE